ncbi:MAG TPA: nicotinate phosphoribosyltransferase [Solirubrobacterales bacterium]|nr:nicotinate phosphoribosyltransferase [Solirubrobacterales bacterium]
MPPDPNDHGLLSAAETSLLTDLYELNMAAGYHRAGIDETAIFELFVRRLPPRRDWLLCAGLGPTLRLITEMRFGPRELEYLESRGFDSSFLDRLSVFRFRGDFDAMPEGTLAFANEPLLRVTAPRIEAQLLETLLLNQVNFQTMAATKAARVVLAAGGGEPGHGDRVVDFSPRRDHGVDAAMKVARSAAVAGCAGTSNVAAAMRYGLAPVGTMAHSFVLSFPSEREAFEAYLEAFPENTTLLVDTFDVEEGVRNAITASQATGVPLGGVRIDSGDLVALARQSRRQLDEAGMRDSEITVSGDLEEVRIAELVGSGAPIDRFGVGTDLGTSRDSPTVNGVYKLVADLGAAGWRGVRKLSAQKETLPGPKQVWRRRQGGLMAGDLVAPDGESHDGEPLLAPFMRGGEICREESLEQIAERAQRELAALPEELRQAQPGPAAAPYPVAFAESLRLID